MFFVIKQIEQNEGRAIINFFPFLFCQSQKVGIETGVAVNVESPAVCESPLPSPCKLIDKCNAAVTNAGNDIERAADQDSDSDSDTDSDRKKKPAFQWVFRKQQPVHTPTNH